MKPKANPTQRPSPGTHPRVMGHPLDYRDGDDRITRSAYGHVTIYYGWFSPEQVAMRRYVAEKLDEAISKTFPHLR